MNIDLPTQWRERLAGYVPVRQTIGKSPAEVFRLEAEGQPALFAKFEEVHPLSELMGEADRLRWLAAAGMPCPAVLDTTTQDGRDWLLMSALPGTDMARSWEVGPDRLAALAAGALRRLHALDVATCPFDNRLDPCIARARARLDAGLVDEDDFDASRLGRTGESAFAELIATRPASEDLVVTHGDASFPNFMLAGEVFAGFIDCGRLGIADRYQDLALACRSAESNFAAGAGVELLRCYGIVKPDREKLAFYNLLDEFF